ncbi:hypothetical protein DSM109990_04153 (plasmid) [Sulfitobacter dubius]|uniref:Uncharacterized protein n=1 Tax=Sulfitobacter dubius TaxID=218673 RepID=A0ABY3ZRJ2_9RHOB|nr:hypothetical protein DSM109990_04153 [Sulfitobacter dubius]
MTRVKVLSEASPFFFRQNICVQMWIFFVFMFDDCLELRAVLLAQKLNVEITPFFIAPHLVWVFFEIINSHRIRHDNSEQGVSVISDFTIPYTFLCLHRSCIIFKHISVLLTQLIKRDAMNEIWRLRLDHMHRKFSVSQCFFDHLIDAVSSFVWFDAIRLDMNELWSHGPLNTADRRKSETLLLRIPVTL